LGVLEALYRAGSRRGVVGFDGAEWLSVRKLCYPIRNGHVTEEKRCLKNFNHYIFTLKMVTARLVQYIELQPRKPKDKTEQ
jgi:hypothetical protein